MVCQGVAGIIWNFRLILVRGAMGRMMEDLFETTEDYRFSEWVHSPAGGEVANRFIRLAWWLKRRGFRKYGAKSIVERLRWHYALRQAHRGRVDGVPARYGYRFEGVVVEDEYKINNNFVSRLARFAVQRAPELDGFFEFRKLG